MTVINQKGDVAKLELHGDATFVSDQEISQALRALLSKKTPMVQTYTSDCTLLTLLPSTEHSLSFCLRCSRLLLLPWCTHSEDTATGIPSPTHLFSSAVPLNYEKVKSF